MPIKLPDTETQLRSMDSWHIRTAITSLTPRVILKNIHRLREVARTCNEFQAQNVAGASRAIRLLCALFPCRTLTARWKK